MKQLSQLYRWKEQINNGGIKQMNINKINTFVKDTFKSAKEENKIIHDTDLRTWGIFI